jgi:hypothetical protein
VRRLVEREPDCDLLTIAETIKRTAFKVTRAGELIGREVARRLGGAARFGIVDLSLAPTPAIGDSVAEILQGDGPRAARRTRQHRRAGAAHRRGQKGRADGVVGGRRPLGCVHPGQQRTRA